NQRPLGRETGVAPEHAGVVVRPEAQLVGGRRARDQIDLQQQRARFGRLCRAPASQQQTEDTRSHPDPPPPGHRLSVPSVPAWMVVFSGDASASPATIPPAMAAVATQPQIHQRARDGAAGGAGEGAGAATSTGAAGSGAEADGSGGAVSSVARTSPPAPSCAAAAPSPPA